MSINPSINITYETQGWFELLKIELRALPSTPQEKVLITRKALMKSPKTTAKNMRLRGWTTMNYATSTLLYHSRSYSKGESFSLAPQSLFIMFTSECWISRPTFPTEKTSNSSMLRYRVLQNHPFCIVPHQVRFGGRRFLLLPSPALLNRSNIQGLWFQTSKNRQRKKAPSRSSTMANVAKVRNQNDSFIHLISLRR